MDKANGTRRVRHAGFLEQRAIGALLDQHFDKEGRRYRNDYSDQRIAAEVGCPISSVSGIRQQHYGTFFTKGVRKARSKGELAALRADVDAMRVLLDDVIRRLAAAGL